MTKVSAQPSAALVSAVSVSVHLSPTHTLCVCDCDSAAQSKPSGRKMEMIFSASYTPTFIYIMANRENASWLMPVQKTFSDFLCVCMSSQYRLLIYLFIFDRGRWWAPWLMTQCTCGTWGKRDRLSCTHSSSAERGNRRVDKWKCAEPVRPSHPFLPSKCVKRAMMN